LIASAASLSGVAKAVGITNAAAADMTATPSARRPVVRLSEFPSRLFLSRIMLISRVRF
jgi:hypothetical protein